MNTADVSRYDGYQCHWKSVESYAENNSKEHYYIENYAKREFLKNGVV